MVGVRKGKNYYSILTSVFCLWTCKSCLYQCHFVQIMLVTLHFTLPLGGDIKMHGEAAYCLSLGYHFSGENETALAVSLFFALAFSISSSSASLVFAEWKKTWRDLAHGPFITLSCSVGRDPCGSSICGSSKFQNWLGLGFHAWICRNNINWQLRLYVTSLPFLVCMWISNSLYLLGF